MALEFSTIGVKVKWAVETTIGSRPTSGYSEIPDIKSIPDISMTPNQIEVTNLQDKVRRFVPGVQDAGSNLQMTANYTRNLVTVWGSMVSAAETAWASGKATWFEIAIPNADSYYIAGMPTALGVNSMGVDAVIETSLSVVPNQIVGWAAAST